MSLESDFISKTNEPRKTPNDPKKPQNDPKMTQNSPHLTPNDPNLTPNDPNLYILPTNGDKSYESSYTFSENDKDNDKPKWVCQHCNKTYSKKCHLTKAP